MNPHRIHIFAPVRGKLVKVHETVVLAHSTKAALTIADASFRSRHGLPTSQQLFVRDVTK